MNEPITPIPSSNFLRVIKGAAVNRPPDPPPPPPRPLPTCQRCQSDRIMHVWGKDHGMILSFKGDELGNQVTPVTDFSYFDFDLCLECGQIQGRFPAADPEPYEWPEGTS